MSISPKRKSAGMEDGPTCSRSGRIRKPKVFYDPSEADAKRRSLPTLEAAKPKKTAKVIETEPTEVKKLDKIAEKAAPKLKPIIPATVPVAAATAVTAGTINSRRRTICVPVYDEETGCIVCARSDTKKGRFVNCIDCIKRGHFTCLRNEKLFKTADKEQNWQCPACKICEYCHEQKSNEDLYKCTICLNSYHLHCSSKIAPLQKNISKKKFACGQCTKRSTTTARPAEAPRGISMNRKSDGFPGFAHDESKKVEQKPTAKASQTTSVKLIIKQKTPPTTNNPIDPVCVNDSMDFKKISVRQDLVEIVESPPKSEIKLENDDEKMDIEYDAKTIMTPHDSSSIPDVRKWDCDEVYTYFYVKAPEYAQLFKDNQIDGDALLLIKREDVLNRFDLKLGPALRLHSHIIALQYKNNNPILAWDEI